MSKNVNVRLSERNLKEIAMLMEDFDVTTASEALRRSIELTSLLMRNTGQGDKLVIEGKDGERREILLNKFDEL